VPVARTFKSDRGRRDASRAADNRHAVDYRHFIDSLKRKPQAVAAYGFLVAQRSVHCGLRSFVLPSCPGRSSKD
jgi:hypothetical protein